METHGRDVHARLTARLSASRRALVVALTLFALFLAGCSGSTSTGGINYSLGLQGATNDHPAAPPRIASTGPDREYAFVYDNQVWVRQKGESAARQVTQLTLSAGANLIWGPLVWSPSGNALAFSLVQNLTPTLPSRASGPIYYIDLSQCLGSSSSACATLQTPMTGSVYGHTYTWFNDALLIAGGGGGISAYDLNDPNGARVWQLRSTQGERQDSYCQQPCAYGDVQVSGNLLYYTSMTLPQIGKTGAIGQAFLSSLRLDPFANAFSISDPVARDQAIATAQNGDQFYGTWFTGLGAVYADLQGNPVAGAWRVSGNTVAYEQIGAVNSKAKQAGRTVCAAYIWNNYCQATLSAVGDQPLDMHAQITVGPGGAVAYQGANLFATKLGAPLASTSSYPPQWVSGDTLLVTSVLSTSTDASGVTREVTSAQLANGSSLTALIAGASDVALR